MFRLQASSGHRNWPRTSPEKCSRSSRPPLSQLRCCCCSLLLRANQRKEKRKTAEAGGGDGLVVVVIGFPEKKKERQRDQEEKEKKTQKKGKKRKKTGEGDRILKKIDFSFIFFLNNNNTKNSQPHNTNHMYLNTHYHLLNNKNYFN